MSALTKRMLAERVLAALRTTHPDAVAGLSGKPEPMGEWSLVTRGAVAETDLLAVYAEICGLPQAEDDACERLERYQTVTYEFLYAHGCVPLSWDSDKAILAVYHPYNLAELRRVWGAMFGISCEFVLGRRSLIEQTLTRVYDIGEEETELLDFDAPTSEQALKDLAREAPVVRLVNDMFSRAIEMRASDIHVEPGEKDMVVRFRIDGVLHTAMTPPLNYYAAIASRLKLIANMNIAERRLPQDGRMDFSIAGEPIDVRVSTVPSMHGESIVLRLLQKDISVFNLDNLGLPGDLRRRIESLVLRPYGMIIAVGPTGSGKTTTLYSIMQLLNSETRKIITIEDPVEYQIAGLTQIQVRPQIGLTFANGLRSIVRQDPDVILVGEIRDRETAEIAIHAALTGHMVFSTLHTNDAAGAVSRLLEMGIEGFLISSAVLGVLSQRLVRRYCGKCHGQGGSDPAHPCRACGGTGYKGRSGIFEFLAVTDQIRNAINQHQDSSEIARLACAQGMKLLRQDGEEKVAAGLTSAAEVARVCQAGDQEL